MAISKGSRTITLDDILDYKSEIDILDFYLGINSLPEIICSPLRGDRNPSFNIDYNDNGNIRCYDFGGENFSGGLFDLLMEMFNISFSELMNKIYDEMISGKPLVKVDRTFTEKPTVTRSKIDNLKVKVREWRSYDLEFWGKFGISLEWLRFGDVYPISHMFITKDNNEMCIPCDKHAYVYVEFKDNKPTYKIYQPFSERYKWINKHDKSVWDLWSKLPAKGEKLIITSSRKDALCLWENLEIPSVCLQAESYDAKVHVMNELIGRFKYIYVLYDNDFKSDKNWGRIAGKKVCDLFGFKQIEIPEIYQSKDPSDLYLNKGKEIFKMILNELIK